MIPNHQLDLLPRVPFRPIASAALSSNLELCLEDDEDCLPPLDNEVLDPSLTPGLLPEIFIGVNSAKSDGVSLDFIGQVIINQEFTVMLDDSPAFGPSSYLPGQLINIIDQPTDLIWTLTPLYKSGGNGKQMVWQVGFDGQCLLMAHGFTDGKVRTDRTQIMTNNSGRSMTNQAMLEARQRYTLKYEAGYMPLGASTPDFTQVMKGHEYEPAQPGTVLCGKKVRAKPGNIKAWPVVTQPKLDGFRMTSFLKFGRIAKSSWKNKPITTMSHLDAELYQFFKYLPPGTMTDGEVFTTTLSFNQMSGVIRADVNLNNQSSQMEYWLFDIRTADLEIPFEHRYRLLDAAYTAYQRDYELDPLNPPSKLRLVLNQLAYSHADLIAHRDQYVAAGAEGLMAKKVSYAVPNYPKLMSECLYREGKHTNIVKMKIFKDEEGLVLGVTDTAGTEAGCAMLIVQDPRGNRFPLRMNGSFERRRQWLICPSLIVGKQVTYKFQELSEYGVPRFPVGKSVRDDF